MPIFVHPQSFHYPIGKLERAAAFAVKDRSPSMIQTLFGSLNEPEKQSIFDRMKQAVTKTRDSLGEKIEGVIALTREVDEASLEDLEMVLLSSDIGVATTTEIVAALRERARRTGIRDGAELKQLLKDQLKHILDEQQRPVSRVDPPLVIMLV